MTKPTLEDLCTWKMVANNDVDKKRLNDIYRTLNRNQACFKCEGYDYKCDCYFNSKGETKEDKK